MKKFIISILILFIMTLGTGFLTFIICEFLNLPKFMTGYLCGVCVMLLYKFLKI